MDNSHAYIHPLYATVVDHTVVAPTISVVHAAFPHEGHGRKPAVRMRSYPGIPAVRPRLHEIRVVVDQQKGIDLFDLLRGQRLFERVLPHHYVVGLNGSFDRHIMRLK